MSRYVLGEYALAVYVPHERRLMLTHDELGLMPLFYRATAEGCTFASHLDDLVFETGVGTLDEEYVADYFARGEHFGERTPYEHIRRLLPGQSIAWSGGRQCRCDTWTLDSVSPLVYRDEREYDEHFRDLVTQAVALAAPREARTWCELSGGLDSSTIFSLAHDRGDLEAVSFLFPQSYTADEREWVERVLAQLPAPWHPLDADAAGPFTRTHRRCSR